MIAALWALSVLCSLAYGLRLTHMPDSGLRSAAKTLAILCLAAIAWFLGGGALLVAAFLASALGDYCLSRPGEGRFLAGMAAFFSAHLFFVLLMVPGFSPAHLPVGPGIGLVLFSLGFYALLWKGLGGFRLPVLAYVGAILAMGLVALGQTGVAAPLFLFAALVFIASDSILALEKFRVDLLGRVAPLAGFAIWGLYYLAQVGFLLTAL